ncbi:MAG TPA: DUF3131 domain-containing protein [Gemmatimonadaceae bacterium]
MRSRNLLIAILALTSIASFAACSNAQSSPQQQTGSAQATQPQAVMTPEERQLYIDAARNSWGFVNSIYRPATGFAKAHAKYSYVTLWDIAGVMAAHFVARDLGFIDDATYDARISKALATLSTIDLFDRSAFNRIYDAETGRMVDNASQISTVGAGWSSTDIGRLLIWLRVIQTRDPKYAPLAAQIVRRLDMGKVLNGGYLQGVDVDPKTGSRKAFIETEMGYQQYATTGFSLWGAKIARDAMDVRANASQVNVLGVKLLVDSRGNDRVMSEPYIMLGLETGYRSPQLRQQALAVLNAQAARHQRTGIVTMVTEDAMPDPPYYFYYYSVYHRGQTFTVEGPGDKLYVEKPRWVSSKAAFGWNAVLPNAYTQLALRTVQPARTANGYGSGVYEGTYAPTGVPSLNTAALIMESALYKTRGVPILTYASSSPMPPVATPAQAATSTPTPVTTPKPAVATPKAVTTQKSTPSKTRRR